MHTARLLTRTHAASHTNFTLCTIMEPFFFKLQKSFCNIGEMFARLFCFISSTKRIDKETVVQSFANISLVGNEVMIEIAGEGMR